MFDKLLNKIENFLKRLLLKKTSNETVYCYLITSDIVSREEAAKAFLEMEITVKYTPVIVEFNRNPHEEPSDQKSAEY